MSVEQPNIISPLQYNVPIVDPNTGVPSPQFIRFFQQLLANNASLSTGAVPASRLINTILPLEGGGDLTADRTLSLAESGVEPGDYTNTNLTIDEFGRILAAANGAGGGGGVQIFGGEMTANKSYTGTEAVTWDIQNIGTWGEISTEDASKIISTGTGAVQWSMNILRDSGTFPTGARINLRRNDVDFWTTNIDGLQAAVFTYPYLTTEEGDEWWIQMVSTGAAWTMRAAGTAISGGFSTL